LEAPYRTVWVSYGTLKCDASDMIVFKKNGGDRRMGDKTNGYTSAPIWADLKRKNIP
jgi:hypothetical protein